MNKPLLVTDCDEVLLYMVTPFRDWLMRDKGIDFNFSNGDFAGALTRQDSGDKVEQAEIWALLNDFFDGQMASQLPIPGALEGLAEIAKVADIVVLTNLLDHRRDDRAAQLAAFGAHYPVVTNQGGKGTALKQLAEAYQPSVMLFIDDLPQHHESAAKHVPDCWRLHMVGEPMLSPHIGCAEKAGHAHVRIDDWADALPWILARLQDAKAAPAVRDAKIAV